PGERVRHRSMLHELMCRSPRDPRGQATRTRSPTAGIRSIADTQSVRVDLLSWNVAGRVALFRNQAAAVSRREPDLVALQEVRPSTLDRWRDALAEAGLGFTVDSSAFLGRRRLLNLTAS